MEVIYLILFVVAALCFIAAAFLGWGWRAADGSAPRRAGWSNIVAFGLFAWVLVDLIRQAKAM